MKVTEIFYSIQGESSYAGYPCVFVRVCGCNLRCSYCDTRYAYDQGEVMELADVVKKISDFHCPLIEITGGEPLLQAETPALVARLLDRGHRVLVETNGSMDINGIDPAAVRIVDVKCPSSGEASRNDLRNLEKLAPEDELKAVIAGREDYEYAKGMVGLLPHGWKSKGKIHFSPVAGRLAPQRLASWILDDHLPVRLHLQLHKLIWPGEQRGR